MKLDVFFTPEEITAADVTDRTAVVIDVLRATSTIIEALANGARGIYPVGGMDEAARLAQNLDRDQLLLCGEKGGKPIEGFDLGNSPLEFCAGTVAEKLLVMATTNGTPALVSVADADDTFVAGFLNLDAVADRLSGRDSVAVVCAAREKRFALEDAVCAGLLVEVVSERLDDTPTVNDAGSAAVALARVYRPELEGLLQMTEAGRQLTDIGYGDDLALCAALDRHSIVPELHDRQITL